jgi:hypothetical protein
MVVVWWIFRVPGLNVTLFSGEPVGMRLKGGRCFLAIPHALVSRFRKYPNPNIELLLGLFGSLMTFEIQEEGGITRLTPGMTVSQGLCSEFGLTEMTLSQQSWASKCGKDDIPSPDDNWYNLTMFKSETPLACSRFERVGVAEHCPPWGNNADDFAHCGSWMKHGGETIYWSPCCNGARHYDADNEMR